MHRECSERETEDFKKAQLLNAQLQTGVGPRIELAKYLQQHVCAPTSKCIAYAASSSQRGR
eukprot:434823-Prymnesium_polylepis.2